MRKSTIAAKTNATLPRISRVANSLERRGLTERTPCPEDARATNMQLTRLGEETYSESRELYAEAVRELVLDGVQRLQGDGVAQLAELSFALLSTLDSERKGGLAYGPEHEAPCAADPAQSVEPTDETCAADPLPEPREVEHGERDLSRSQ